ncbi:MAG: thiamine pyrophosphate-dependent dehydrogenase E1 component subunit alpha [Candidatus Ranarchaeia archaeon]
MSAPNDINEEKLIEMYQSMLRIRFFEEKIAELKTAGKIPGYPHCAVGQEAAIVGAAANLNEDDYITSTHRGHGHNIAKGARLDKMFAEIMAREDGYCKGKGGTMHACDYEKGVLGVFSVVGDNIPVATGAGLAIQIKGTKQVALAFFGDGAANTGAFHESLNMAAVWKLPVIFLLENNQYALTTYYRKTYAIDDLSKRAIAYGIHGERVDGNDIVAVYRAVRKAVERARAGEGPSLIECYTYRIRGSAEGGDPNMGCSYRSMAEIEEWMKKDPIGRFEKQLLEWGILDASGVEEVRENIAKETEEAADWADKSPAPRPGDVAKGVYAE